MQTTEYHYERDPDERPSEAVVRAVADATGRSAVPYGATGSDPDANALPPLYEQLDPDALDRLVTGDSTREANCFVTFTYDGYTVSISDQLVTVTSTE